MWKDQVKKMEVIRNELRERRRSCLCRLMYARRIEKKEQWKKWITEVEKWKEVITEAERSTQVEGGSEQ